MLYERLVERIFKGEERALHSFFLLLLGGKKKRGRSSFFSFSLEDVGESRRERASAFLVSEEGKRV